MENENLGTTSVLMENENLGTTSVLLIGEDASVISICADNFTNAVHSFEEAGGFLKDALEALPTQYSITDKWTLEEFEAYRNELRRKIALYDTMQSFMQQDRYEIVLERFSEDLPKGVFFLG